MIHDEALTRRIEGAIADERRSFAEGMAARHPETGAGWAAVAGGYAVFTGRGFFANRAFGLGTAGAVTADHLEEVEAFYRERQVAPAVEIASTDARALIELLVARGYRMVRFHNVYARTLAASTGPATAEGDGIAVEEVRDDATATAWSAVLLDGFGYEAQDDRERVERWNRMLHSLPTVHAVLARVEGRPAGAASVLRLGDTALLGGAATLPYFRRQGVQRRLIRARLERASREGCRLAIVTADPDSSSGRNAERCGFRLSHVHLALHAP